MLLDNQKKSIVCWVASSNVASKSTTRAKLQFCSNTVSWFFHSCLGPGNTERCPSDWHGKQLLACKLTKLSESRETVQKCIQTLPFQTLLQNKVCLKCAKKTCKCVKQFKTLFCQLFVAREKEQHVMSLHHTQRQLAWPYIQDSKSARTEDIKCLSWDMAKTKFCNAQNCSEIHCARESLKALPHVTQLTQESLTIHDASHFKIGTRVISCTCDAQSTPAWDNWHQNLTACQWCSAWMEKRFVRFGAVPWWSMTHVSTLQRASFVKRTSSMSTKGTVCVRGWRRRRR